MRKNLRKMLLISSLTVTASLGLAGSIVTPFIKVPNTSVNNEKSNSLISTRNYVASSSGGSAQNMVDNTQNIKTISKQSYATNNSGNSYAILVNDGSSGGQSKTAGNNTTANAIARFDLKGAKQGQSVWKKGLADLQPKTSSGSTQKSTFTATTIHAIVYTAGSQLSSEGFLHVLASSSNNETHIFKLNWSDGAVVSSQKLTNGASSTYTGESGAQTNTPGQPNLLVVTDSSKDNVVAISAGEISTTNADLSLNYYPVNYSNNSGSDTQINNKTITISKELLVSNFDNNMFVTDILTKNGITYLAYQKENLETTSGKVSHAVVKIQFSSTGDVINTISQNEIGSYKLTAADIEVLNSKTSKRNTLAANTTPIKVNLVDLGNSSSGFATVLSSKKSNPTGPSSIIVSKFSSSNIAFSSVTHNNYPTLIAIAGAKQQNQNSGLITQIRPYYGGVNGTHNGFIALDSQNKVVLLDNDLKPESILRDFGTTNTVYHISTIQGITDWFPQDTDSKIADFFGSTLIGQLDSISSTSTTETLVHYNIKGNNELSLAVKFMKAINGSTGTPEFENFIKRENSYNEFLDIISSDVRFPNPKISITAANYNNTQKSVELTFKQQLRQRDSSGIFTDTGQPYEIGKYTYKFINDNATFVQQSKEQVPLTILKKLPSEITKDDVEKHLLKTTNTEGASYLFNPDDKNGILGITVNYPYLWEEGVLKTNVFKEFTFGSESQPFFAIDKLVGYNKSVTPITKEYLAKDENAEKAKTLGIKYSVTLPSELKPKQFLDDFVELGAAFSNPTLISRGDIIPPTEKDIIITPIDVEGVALIDLIIPKIGDKEDIRFEFVTADVFKKNPFANSNFYFMFENNETVINKKWDSSDQNANTLNKYQPSLLANTLNSEKNMLREKMDLFADFSPYVGNLIASNSDTVQVTATGNDLAGTLEIKLKFKDNVEGLGGKEFSEVFTGFTNVGTINVEKSKFSFKDWTDNNAKANAPSLVTMDQITPLFNYEGSSSQTLNKEIEILPVNTYGTLEVRVTFKNWIEEDKNKKKYIVPEKRFSITYTGFARTKDPMDMLVFKSFYELDELWQKGLTASQVVNLVMGENKINQLNKFANISNSLNDYLLANEANLDVNISFNDIKGSITIIASIIKENGETSVVSSTISGFEVDNSNIAIIMSRNDSEIALKLKNKQPSQLSEEEISDLYIVSSGNSLKKNIVTNFDDLNGTLKLTVQLLDTKGLVISENTADYTGFKTNIPEYTPTNWLVLSMSIIIPLLILLTPILFIKFYLDRKDMKSIANKLDNTLTNETKKKRNKNIRSIKDLLNE